MSNRELPMNHYGESLNTTSDFFLMKQQYEESLISLDDEELACGKLQENVPTNNVKKEEILLHVKEQSSIFEIRLKENQPDNQEVSYEENLLRNNVEHPGEARDNSEMV